MTGSSPIRVGRRSAAAIALAIASILPLLLSGNASAALSRPFVRGFAAPGPTPAALAFDSSDDLYVVNIGAPNSIEKLSTTGAPVPFSGSAGYITGNRITGTPAAPFSFESFLTTEIAVDNSGGPTDGYIYVDTGYTNGGGVDVFDSTGIYKGFLSAGGAPACGVAVDGGGNVYVAAPFVSLVTRYAPTNGNPAEYTTTGKLQGAEYPCSIEVDSTGAASVSSWPFSASHRYEASQFGVETAVGTEIEPYPSPQALALEPASGNLLMDFGNRVVERNAANAQVGVTIGEGDPPSESRGVAADSAGNVYVSDLSGEVSVYGPGPAVDLPLVTAVPAPAVERNSATLAGEVDPDGAGPVTECKIEYGRNFGYTDGTVPCVPAASGGSPFTAATAVTAEVAGLLPGTTYHFRVFAKNANGVQASHDQTLTTPVSVAGVTTGEASEITKDSVTLNGSFTGDGNDTHYYFEYGTSTGYGTKVPVPPGNDAGTATGEVVVAPVPVTGIQGSTEYHYRLVATNSFGPAYGEDRTFVSAPSVTNLSTDPASEVSNAAAVLNGSFDGDKYDTHYFFEYGPTPNYGQTAPAPPGNDAGSGSGRITVEGVPVSGLQQGATYHFRIVATNAVGRTNGPDATFKTANGPAITQFSAEDVTATTARLTASINPRQADTAYRFEYGQTTSYGTSIPIPDEDIGAGTTDVAVSQLVEGLEVGRTYHFRVVAYNQYGTVTSGDQSFGFYPPACPNSQLREETHSGNLPDCRAYELASAAYAEGTTVFPASGPNTGLATNPAKLSYGGGFGAIPGTGDPVNTIGDLYTATRTNTGWTTKYIGRGGNETQEMGAPPEAGLFGLLNQESDWNQIGTQADPLMNRILDYDDGNPTFEINKGIGSNGPYVWNSETGSLAARWPTNLAEITGGDDFVGKPTASADFSHFVFSSNVVFADGGVATVPPEGSPPLLQGAIGYRAWAASVYDNDTETGAVEHVSVLKNGNDFAGIPLNVSTDGSHILMAEGNNTLEGKEGPIVLRVDDETTYEIADGANVRYLGSTADGKTIYFTSPEQLTPDDEDTSSDLFRWTEADPEHLTRISAGSGGEAGNSDDCAVPWATKCGVLPISFTNYSTLQAGLGGNRVTDNFIASKSGEIYFQSPEQLDGAEGEVGQVNLYVYREGHAKFVTTMSDKQLCTEDQGEPRCSEGPIARMQVSPDGSHAAFITASQVTSYDNAGKGEMYTYAPAGERLLCASCIPSGASPTVDVYGSQNGLFMTYDGRAFFSTADALVLRDTNEITDTYEFVEGKPQLISTGIGSSPTGFTGFNGLITVPGLDGVSADGTDVYFATYDSLTTQDHNGQEIKIYDARANGGFPAELPPPGCAAADECHGAGSSAPATIVKGAAATLGKGSNVQQKKAHHKKGHRKGKKKRHRRHHRMTKKGGDRG